ncbi:maf [Mytilus coruscus]|uniref:Maf n=1 Tax=Mytilus coruscus TaxID=42192 RepID=A0A6J8EUE6_MYTCO|nr:maf [Mytilus coruscus]
MNIRLKFEIVKSNFEENLEKSSFRSPVDYVKETAKQKTIEVASILADKQTPVDLVIGADTVVTHNNVIFEKPRDKTHACEMLKQFSGSIHDSMDSLFKGDRLCPEDERFYITEFQESTDVMMTKLTPEIISSYVDTGEALDKAGGYGIQAVGGTLIEGIKGDYFNTNSTKPVDKLYYTIRQTLPNQRTISTILLDKIYQTSEQTLPNKWTNSTILLDKLYQTRGQTLPIHRHTLRQTSRHNVKPVDTLYIKPVDTLYIKPVDKLYVKPVDTLYIKPVDKLYVKPVDTLYIKPVDTLYIKPVDKLYIKPVDTLYVKPVDTLYIKPIDKLFIKPVDTLYIKPVDKLCQTSRHTLHQTSRHSLH